MRGRVAGIVRSVAVLLPKVGIDQVSTFRTLRPEVTAADEFTPAGTYRGFSVYRAKSGDGERIWVSVVPDSPVAPYEKR